MQNSNLKKMRNKKGYSQNDLAVASGVAKKTIQCYEQRSRHIDAANLAALCNISLALGCRIEDILEDEALIKSYKRVNRNN